MVLVFLVIALRVSLWSSECKVGSGGGRWACMMAARRADWRVRAGGPPSLPPLSVLQADLNLLYASPACNNNGLQLPVTELLGVLSLPNCCRRR